MKFFFKMDEISEETRSKVGGKAYNLSILQRNQIKIPKTLVLSSEIYDKFVKSSRLKERIPFVINKKPLNAMRWEEIWDLAIHIQNLFIKTKLSPELRTIILNGIEDYLGLNNLAIRSSSAFEDSPKYSFAGLHESYINISGPESIIKYIKLVWASLWSNRALMYRNELDLEVERASMAVVLQDIIEGSVSGIAFGKDPLGKNNIIIEAIYGLNQALVDGSIEPDRWIFDKKTHNLIQKTTPQRSKFLKSSKNGVVFEKLPTDLISKAPLEHQDLKRIQKVIQKVEKLYGYPHEIEWTIRDRILYVLQCRPITTIKKNDTGYKNDDQRPWYLSLVRSFEDLKIIRDKVENEYFPKMEMVAEGLKVMNLNNLSDQALSSEIERRWVIFKHWKDVYWREFIPLAHGIRLFGKTYNEVVEPEDPIEFTKLLSGTNMISTNRNQAMQKIASLIRKDKELLMKIKDGNLKDKKLKNVINIIKDQIIENSADLQFEEDIEKLLNLLIEMANTNRKYTLGEADDFSDLKEKYLSSFPKEKKTFAEDLLKLGRDCYRLRDDDNIYLGKIEKHYLETINLGIARLKQKGLQDAELYNRKQIVLSLRDSNYEPEKIVDTAPSSELFDIKARQIVGQAASSGIARGKARVVKSKEDIFEFKQGEILVVDSVEPNMTFIVPLAAGIVERRGGILVHGAIIAREYEIPCVTGVVDASKLIVTGDKLTVDGYLGIVIIQK